jgi:hypothetical protein
MLVYEMSKRKMRKAIKKQVRNQQDMDALQEALFILRSGLILRGVRVVD